MPSAIKKVLSGGVAALALATAACTATSTPYQPLSASSRVSGGYSEIKLAEGHFTVSFAGNRLTSRETVEAYLLFRAAELTIQQGYDWFVIHDRELEHHVERRVVPDPLYNPWFDGHFGYWRPYWRYYGPGTGWRYWYPYTRDPFWADRVDIRTIETFEATADIEMGRGEMPPAGSRAFDARSVIEQIGPRVEYPDS